MKEIDLTALAAQMRAAEQGRTSGTSLVVGPDGVISERTRDDEGRRDLSSLTAETFAARRGAPVVVLDTVLDDIEACIAAHRPERGGALFGPAGESLVVEFVHDEWASTTSSSYNASLASGNGGEGDSLEWAVRLVEMATPMRYLGTVHSHPGRMDRPSGQDLVAFADTIRINPWMEEFLGPIVTAGPVARLAAHETAVPSGKVSWFVARVDPRTGQVRCEAHPARVVALGAALGRVEDRLEVAATSWELTCVNDETALAATLTWGDGLAAQIYVWPSLFPLVPPLVTVTDGDSTPIGVPVTWDLAVPEDDRLAAAVSAALHRAPRRGRAPVSTEAVRDGLDARLAGMVPAEVRDARVLILGAGSVGSVMAELLARSGVEDFAVVDPETVGAENLSRTVYVADDVGQPKVDALRHRLQAINPGITVDGRAEPLAGLDPDALDALISGSALVVATTDDPSAQALADRFAYGRGVPAVYPAMYAKGHGGEVVFAVPGLTRCYRCATAIRHSQGDAVRPPADYGTDGRLLGEVALGADIAHVTTAAAKVALALLSLGDPQSPLGRDFLVPGMVSGGHGPASIVQLSTVPGYSFFADLFADVPGQAAWQTVWMAVAGDPSCPSCGDEEYRADPLAAPVAPPDPSLIIAGLAAADPFPPAAAPHPGHGPCDPADAVAADSAVPPAAAPGSAAVGTAAPRVASPPASDRWGRLGHDTSTHRGG